MKSSSVTTSSREILSPSRFVAVRRTLGGPAPDVTARAIEVSRAQLSADAAWLDAARQSLAAADRLRRQAVEGI